MVLVDVKKILLTIANLLVISCGISNIEEPKQYAQVSHREAMNERFKTKDQVFIEFGSADNKDESNGIESWTYELASRTMGNSLTLGKTNSSLGQNPNNPNLREIDRTLQSSGNWTSTSISSSKTTKDYVKFWFSEDGKVIKWESIGLDLSYQREVASASFNELEKPKESRNSENAKPLKSAFAVGIAVVAIILFLI